MGNTQTLWWNNITSTHLVNTTKCLNFQLQFILRHKWKNVFARCIELKRYQLPSNDDDLMSMCTYGWDEYFVIFNWLNFSFDWNYIYHHNCIYFCVRGMFTSKLKPRRKLTHFWQERKKHSQTLKKFVELEKFIFHFNLARCSGRWGGIIGTCVVMVILENESYLLLLALSLGYSQQIEIKRERKRDIAPSTYVYTVGNKTGALVTLKLLFFLLLYKYSSLLL